MVTSKPNSQWFPKNHWTCQWSSQINIILKVWNYPVVTISILIWLVCRKVWISCLDIYCRALQLQTKFTSCQLSFCMLYTVTSSPPESFIRIALLFMTLHLHGVYDILRHSICCIVLISHCEIISGVIRYGPYHLDSTDVHLRVLLKICIFSEIDFMHFLGATGHPNHR